MWVKIQNYVVEDVAYVTNTYVLISLGADVIYDPSCLPHLLRVLVALLSKPPKRDKVSLETEDSDTTPQGHSPKVAYIASVIRNADTFNVFLTLVDQMDLSITDVTAELRPPFELLPYMHSYDRSSVRLFSISSRWCNSFRSTLISLQSKSKILGPLIETFSKMVVGWSYRRLKSLLLAFHVFAEMWMLILD